MKIKGRTTRAKTKNTKTTMDEKRRKKGDDRHRLVIDLRGLDEKRKEGTVKARPRRRENGTISAEAGKGELLHPGT